MRRAASLRSHQRSATTSSTGGAGSDELGMVREDGGDEDLRKAQRENEKLRDQLQALQAMLAQRPSLEHVQDLQKEYSNLDLILQGTQRENERCMAELERGKQREKALEGYLNKLVGENWQTIVGVAPAVPVPRGSLGGGIGPRVNSPVQSPAAAEVSTENKLAQLEQIRMLVLGMDQRLQTREEALSKALERAEAQGARYESLAKELEVGQSLVALRK